jgi:hypothetical protein
MKKLKRLFLLLLIIPFAFSIAACKDKSGGDGGTPSPSNPNENVTLETFSIAYDYNLPEKYDFLLTDYTHSNNAVGTSVTFPACVTDSDTRLSALFSTFFIRYPNQNEIEHKIKSDWHFKTTFFKMTRDIGSYNEFEPKFL